MASFSSRLARAALVAFLGATCAEACGSSASDDSTPGGNAKGGMSGAGGSRVVMPDAGTPTPEAGANSINPLCGVTSLRCDPDFVGSCTGVSGAPSSRLDLQGLGGASNGGTPGAPGPALGADAGSGGALGGAGGEAGAQSAAGGVEAGGSSAGSPATGGAAYASAGESGLGGSGAASGGPATGTPQYACRVTRVENNPNAMCAESGSGLLGSPCFSGSDCSAGLACARYRGVARCLPYCCHGEESCQSGSYCSEQPLVDDSIPSSVSSMLVPVCTPADSCNLAVPPCEDGVSCECPAGKACLAVRADGTTTCEKPGTGGLGEACPCQYGFICSFASGTGSCQRLCQTVAIGETARTCEAGRRCQISAELPPGWGVCVGG